MNIYFDVGCNNGSSSIRWAAENQMNLVYAFDPDPVCANWVRNVASQYSNYHFYQVAVSDYNGKAQFNISGQPDRGSCSLLEFSENAQSLNEAWRVVEKVECEVIRLEDFIVKHNIENIKYFHCDAQGSDLKVLKGMGDHIMKIEEGQIECASEPNFYYVGESYYEDCVNYLESKNFKILALVYLGGQYDLKFARR